MRMLIGQLNDNYETFTHKLLNGMSTTTTTATAAITAAITSTTTATLATSATKVTLENHLNSATRKFALSC